jgi:hypothetical protein
MELDSLLPEARMAGHVLDIRQVERTHGKEALAGFEVAATQ